MGRLAKAESLGPLFGEVVGDLLPIHEKPHPALAVLEGRGQGDVMPLVGF